VYAGRHGSGALILRDQPQSPVEPVQLPGLSAGTAAENIRRLLAARWTIADPGTSRGERAAAEQQLTRVLEWAWDAIAEPIMNRLGRAGTPAGSETGPHLWWCPVGSLSYLPLHAAGYHRDRPAAAPARSVLDRALSSYTVTARALAFARQRSPDPDPGGSGALVVAVPELAGATPLPGASSEAECIGRYIPSALQLSGPAATRAAVLRALSAHAVAHFACHGLSDWSDPTRSRLLLHDDAREPLTAGAITQLRLDHAELAYLSACSTAETAPAAADEAVHIASAFQLAGYSHVVATLWPVGDATAARVCDDFYRTITADGTRPPATARAAAALHEAVRRLRDERPGNPFSWAGYLHVGTPA
jgi:hypothetical protein